MQDIRNSKGKLVCRVDRKSRTVEISVKGDITVIRFTNDGEMKVTNIDKAA